jgi:hypothetical protein
LQVSQEGPIYLKRQAAGFPKAFSLNVSPMTLQIAIVIAIVLTVGVFASAIVFVTKDPRGCE